MQSSILSAILWLGLGSYAWGQPGPPTVVPALGKVEFESAPRPLGKLQERRARERGEDPKPTPGDRLQGYLVKPEGGGPFPAIIVMPGCAGLTSYIKEALPQRLVGWGYVALVVDSLTTRKVEPNCLKDSASVDRMADAYGGLFYLAALPFVDRNRIGVLGVSFGGRVPLILAEAQTDTTIANPEKLTFKAGVAYYPTCTASKDSPSFPLLIMVGRFDQAVKAWTCEDLVASRAGSRVPTELMVYPEARHGFIERDWTTAQDAYGVRVEYNEKAAEDSLRRAQEFFARNLKG